MSKAVWGSIARNLALTVAFAALSNRALGAGLEETLVALALFYGVLVTLVNAEHVAAVLRKRG